MSVNAAAAILGRPLAWVPVAHALDIALAALLLAICLWTLKQPVNLRRSLQVPVVIQLLLAWTITVSLLWNYDPVSLRHYLRYIGGNVTLFGVGILCCRKELAIRLICRVCLVAGVLQGGLGIWFTMKGLGWASARAAFVPGIGTSLGYTCGFAVLYTVIGRDPWLRPFAILPLLIAGFGVLVGGSKIALLLTLAFLVLSYMFNVLHAQRIAPAKVALGLLLLPVTGVSSYVFLSSEHSGMGREILDSESFADSFEGRMSLFKRFGDSSMDNLLVGSGISAAYDEGYGFDMISRTHSVLSSLLVQIGVPGVLLYILFLTFCLLFGGRALCATSPSAPNYHLLAFLNVAVFFLLLKAEVTSDVPGNRSLWIFSALLLNYCVLYLQDASRYRFGGQALP